jgi:CHAT domain-containing protein
MGSDTYRAEIVRLQKDLASLQSELGKQEGLAANARAEAAKKRKAAMDTNSMSIRQSNLRAAESEDKKVVAAEKKIGDLRSKVASTSERQHRAENNLASALKSERAAAERVEDARRRKEKSDRESRDRQDARRRQTERDHAREISRLSSVTVRHVLEREPEPEKLRVLYLTSSPELGDPLRVDAEVNNVLKALRGAKHRDLIELFHRPAATPQDLVDGINDIRPHVIHFSGHGGSGGLVFDNASLDAPVSQAVDFASIAGLLRATNFPPTLAVLNACQTDVGVEPLLEAVPVVIAMSDSVGDMSAGLFATHFYAAIGGAQSIGHAVAQARTMVSIALPGEPDLVELRAAPDVDVDALVLVRPI